MAATPTQAKTMRDVDEFWDDLLLHIRRKRVIPVIGAELLSITEQGQTASLYQVVAQRLLSKYNLWSGGSWRAEYGRTGHELNNAVCSLAAAGHRVKDIYPRIADILDQLLVTHPDASEPLRSIAAITDFDLFIATTPDNLLVQAINAERFKGSDLTHEIVYAPNLPFDLQGDIPETLLPGYVVVFYIFGKADVRPFYAIHDEDALEFSYSLSSKGPERMFAKLQSCDLLLVGCAFYDWLSRFFLRISNSARLASDRDKKEYLVGKETAGDQDLTKFLKRFSQDSRCYPGEARAFVAELYRRWQALPRHSQPSGLSSGRTVVSDPAMVGRSIFISYAHEDIAAARALFTELQTIGADVIWFDKTELKPGDVWDSKTLGAIDQCHLFLPLISVTSETRDEGYFKREWNRAAHRSESIIGRKYIFPIVIDPDYTGDRDQYKLVPEVFKTFQYTHAPSGHMTDALRDEITNEIRRIRRLRSLWR